MSRIMSKNKCSAQTMEAWIQDGIYGTTGVVRYDCNTIKVLIVQLIKGYYSWKAPNTNFSLFLGNSTSLNWEQTCWRPGV